MSVGVRVVALFNIGAVVGCGPHKHRDMSKLGMAFEVLEYFMAMHTRKIQIQHDEVGQGLPRVMLLLLKILDGLLAIGDMLPLNVGVAQGFLEEEHVCLAVFNKKNVKTSMGIHRT